MSQPDASKKEIGKGASNQKWVAMAQERNARVVLCNAPETYALMDLARNVDRIVNSTRKRLAISIRAEEAIPLLQQFHEKIIDIDSHLDKMAQLAAIEYRQPRGIKRLIHFLGGNGDGDGNGAVNAEGDSSGSKNVIAELDDDE